MSCQICNSTESLQHHHDSYNPPKVRILCTSCHRKFHQRAYTGKPSSNLNRCQHNSKKTYIYVQLEFTNEEYNRLNKIINNNLFLNFDDYIRNEIYNKIRQEEHYQRYKHLLPYYIEQYKKMAEASRFYKEMLEEE